MAKFRVGDVVERIRRDHCGGMKMGEEGTVTYVYGDGGISIGGRLRGWGAPDYFKLAGDVWVDAFGVRHAK